MASARIGANVLAPTPLATTRWFDGSGVNAFKQPCRCPYRRRRRSARRPTASDAEPVQQPALQQPALQPARGLRSPRRTHRRKANGVVADAARGDGCRARAGRHHGEPGLQAGPHPRAARHAASAACHVGFSQKQAVSAATAFGAANTSAPPMRSAPPVRSAQPTFHREEARVRALKLRTTSAPGSCPQSTPARGAQSTAARSAGAAGHRHAGPARPQRAALTETAVTAIFPAGAAGCERTRSGRCGARA